MHHKDLEAWKLSMDLVIKIYKITKSFPENEKFALTSQICRAAVSIPSNIAEGCGRGTDKDTLRFLTGGCYLVLEVYDEQEHFLFDLSQNELSALFSLAATPYEPIGKLYAAQSKKNEPKEDFYEKKQEKSVENL